MIIITCWLLHIDRSDLDTSWKLPLLHSGAVTSHDNLSDDLDYTHIRTSVQATVYVHISVGVGAIVAKLCIRPIAPARSIIPFGPVSSKYYQISRNTDYPLNGAYWLLDALHIAIKSYTSALRPMKWRNDIGALQFSICDVIIRLYPIKRTPQL